MKAFGIYLYISFTNIRSMPLLLEFKLVKTSAISYAFVFDNVLIVFSNSMFICKSNKRDSVKD